MRLFLVYIVIWLGCCYLLGRLGLVSLLHAFWEALKAVNGVLRTRVPRNGTHYSVRITLRRACGPFHRNLTQSALFINWRVDVLVCSRSWSLFCQAVFLLFFFDFGKQFFSDFEFGFVLEGLDFNCAFDIQIQKLFEGRLHYLNVEGRGVLWGFEYTHHRTWRIQSWVRPRIGGCAGVRSWIRLAPLVAQGYNFDVFQLAWIIAKSVTFRGKAVAKPPLTKAFLFDFGHFMGNKWRLNLWKVLISWQNYSWIGIWQFCISWCNFLNFLCMLNLTFKRNNLFLILF